MIKVKTGKHGIVRDLFPQMVSNCHCDQGRTVSSDILTNKQKTKSTNQTVSPNKIFVPKLNYPSQNVALCVSFFMQQYFKELQQQTMSDGRTTSFFSGFSIYAVLYK